MSLYIVIRASCRLSIANRRPVEMRIQQQQQRLCSASASADSPSSVEVSAVHHHSPIGALMAVLTRPAENQPTRNRHLLAVIFIVLCFTCLVSYYVMLVANNNQQGSERIQQLLMAVMEDNLSFLNREPFEGKLENGTVLGEPHNRHNVVLPSIVERYRLVERYDEQDKLLAHDTSAAVSAAPFKRILFWNDFFGIPDFRLGIGRDAFRKWGCPVWQCETSTNRTDVHNYDAIIFHMRSWNRNDLPKRRTPQQRYIFWLLESAGWPEYLPMHTSSLGNIFNWTLTYRWDSDMVMPYGYVIPTGKVPLHPSEDQLKKLMSVQKVNYAAGKTKMVSWMVSNCGAHSNRLQMVKILQKYIEIDVYGACGNLTCPKRADEDNSSEECRDMAGQNYKFYMALENTLCRDYITEKFFGMLQRPVIPIVFGLHDHYDQIAPPHSFINAAKFENMTQLADYLILLDRNDTLYNEYFWWKPHFESRYKQKDVNIGMCHLCASLHNKELPPKTYSNMTDWWDERSACINSPPIS